MAVSPPLEKFLPTPLTRGQFLKTFFAKNMSEEHYAKYAISVFNMNSNRVRP